MVYGLVGTIGSGKSTILNMICEMYNCYCIQADHIGHETLLKDHIIMDIVEAFGNKVLDETGQINRKALGAIVFKNKDEMDKLNKIMQHDMKETVVKRIAENEAYYDFIILEAAILIEAKWQHIVDKIVLVTCEQETRIQRLMDNRGMKREQILDVKKHQCTEENLKRQSDYIIDNSGDLDIARMQIEKIFQGDRG